MVTTQQFEKAKQFIYRYGRLLDRRRFSFHFEGGSQEAALQALMCYQNADGGFGHGLELDVLCPASSPVCAEAALLYLNDLGITEGEAIDRLETWILMAQQEDGTLLNPIDAIVAYPHGPWWADADEIRVFSLAGLLARLGRGSEAFFGRVERLFDMQPFPDRVDIYSYPFHLYLRYALGAERFADRRDQVRGQMPDLLRRFENHHPLFIFCDRWEFEDVSRDVLASEARRAVAYLADDGGMETPYPDLPWWRPVWTLDLLVALKRFGFIDASASVGSSGD
jgi:hypothetical protein